MRKIFPIIMAIMLIVALFFGFTAACRSHEAVLRFIRNGGTIALALLLLVFVLSTYSAAIGNSLEPERKKILGKRHLWIFLVGMSIAANIALSLTSSLCFGLINAYRNTPDAVLNFVSEAGKTFKMLTLATVPLVALFGTAAGIDRKPKPDDDWRESRFWGNIFCLSMAILVFFILMVAVLVCFAVEHWGIPELPTTQISI